MGLGGEGGNHDLTRKPLVEISNDAWSHFHHKKTKKQKKQTKKKQRDRSTTTKDDKKAGKFSHKDGKDASCEEEVFT